MPHDISPDDYIWSLMIMLAGAFLIGGWFERELIKRDEAKKWRGSDAFREAMKNAAPGDKTDVRV